MLKNAPILICGLILIISGFTFHEFYVSLCKIDHNAETSALEITMRIFTDDLENGITGSQDFYGLGTIDEPADSDSLIFSYILENFKVNLDGNCMKLNYIGKEVEVDVTWIYIEIEEVEFIGRIEVSNHMLTELFEGQVNVVNVNYTGKTLGLLLKQDSPTGVLKF
jgi:hypothetical protein